MNVPLNFHSLHFTPQKFENMLNMSLIIIFKWKNQVKIMNKLIIKATLHMISEFEGRIKAYHQF